MKRAQPSGYIIPFKAKKKKPVPFRVRWQKAMMSSALLMPSEKLVGVAIAARTDSKRACWPSLRMLASDTGLSRPTVQRAVTKLRDEGWIVTRQSASRTSLVFHLKMPGAPFREVVSPVIAGGINGDTLIVQEQSNLKDLALR